MRMYGMRSGRNNMNKMLDRSYIRNSKKNSNVDEDPFGTFILYGIVILAVLAVLW